MKELILTKGKKSMVDDEDFEFLSKWKWQLHPSAASNNFYASRGTTINYNSKRHLLHRQILRITDPKISVDHIDGNGLNNQKSNLRICSHSENMRNSKKRENASSRFKGLSWDSKRESWNVRCHLNSKTLRIGRYKSELEAALAYNVTASFAHGQFANLNKI